MSMSAFAAPVLAVYLIFWQSFHKSARMLLRMD